MPRLAPALLCALLGLQLVGAAARADEALFSGDGYRITRYRSPTPAQAEHATTLDTAGLRALLASEPRTQLIDVYRNTWLDGRFVATEKHRNLPGSLWLANTGDGQLSPPWQAYFADNLKRLSGGDNARPLVFYCRADCWASWNAVKRAHALGYSRLYWYRDGVDTWEQAGLPLQDAQPQPLP